MGDRMREELQEKYEDALFALLMDDYARVEGARLYHENEQLKQDPSFALPEGMEKRGRKVIAGAFRKKAGRNILRSGRKLLTRAAVIVLVLNVVFAATFLSVEAFRVEVLNMALKYQETHATVTFSDEMSRNVNPDVYDAYDVLRALPSGYEIMSDNEIPNGEIAEFTGPDGTYLQWFVNSTNDTVNIDTEDADRIEHVTIDGFEGILVEKDGYSSLLWGDTENKVIYRIIVETGKIDVIAVANEIVGP